MCHCGEEGVFYWIRVLIDHVRRAQLPLCAWCAAILTLILWLSFPIETFLFWPWSFDLGALRPPILLSSKLPRLIIRRDSSRYGILSTSLMNCDSVGPSSPQEDSKILCRLSIKFFVTKMLACLCGTPAPSVFVCATDCLLHARLPA